MLMLMLILMLVMMLSIWADADAVSNTTSYTAYHRPSDSHFSLHFVSFITCFLWNPCPYWSIVVKISQWFGLHLHLISLYMIWGFVFGKYNLIFCLLLVQKKTPIGYRLNIFQLHNFFTASICSFTPSHHHHHHHQDPSRCRSRYRRWCIWSLHFFLLYLQSIPWRKECCSWRRGGHPIKKCLQDACMVP